MVEDKFKKWAFPVFVIGAGWFFPVVLRYDVTWMIALACYFWIVVWECRGWTGGVAALVMLGLVAIKGADVFLNGLYWVVVVGVAMWPIPIKEEREPEDPGEWIKRQINSGWE